MAVAHGWGEWSEWVEWKDQCYSSLMVVKCEAVVNIETWTETAGEVVEVDDES